MLIGYARVSTEDQNLDLQIDDLKKAGCEKVYQEKVSGSKERRAELEEALSYVRKGDTLVVWKLDRLGRSLRNLINIINKLQENDIQFKTLREGFDTSTSGGKLIFHVFGALAEFEREVIQERTKAGLRAARARGRLGGRPKKLTKEIKADIAYAFEDSITDVLVKKTVQALKQEGLKRVIISGGVGANKTLRKKIIAECNQNEFEYFFPDLTFCTDNGAMIALAGSLRLNMRPKENYSFSVKPRWKLTEI